MQLYKMVRLRVIPFSHFSKILSYINVNRKHWEFIKIYKTNQADEMNLYFQGAFSKSWSAQILTPELPIVNTKLFLPKPVKMTFESSSRNT